MLKQRSHELGKRSIYLSRVPTESSDASGRPLTAKHVARLDQTDGNPLRRCAEGCEDARHTAARNQNIDRSVCHQVIEPKGFGELR